MPGYCELVELLDGVELLADVTLLAVDDDPPEKPERYPRVILKSVLVELALDVVTLDADKSVADVGRLPDAKDGRDEDVDAETVESGAAPPVAVVLAINSLEGSLYDIY